MQLVENNSKDGEEVQYKWDIDGSELSSSGEDTQDNEEHKVPIDKLITMPGTLNGRQVTVLKDDGCNTNVISRSFANRFRPFLDIRKSHYVVSHSNQGSTEDTDEMVYDTEVQIGSHRYRSNWVIADCRYDVLLGMPWHVETNPGVSYDPKQLHVGGSVLPLAQDTRGPVKIQNIGVKKFRSLLRKKKASSDFAVFQLRHINNITTTNREQEVDETDADLENLKREFATVFRNELPEGLPPERDVDHKIEIDPNEEPPYRGIYQLSPAELLATKEYVADLLKRKKIRPSKSPYGAPLFFVKQKGQLRGVIDYRELNRITKHNNSPIPRTDEMFDRLGRATFFSRLDLKTDFHQIRIAPADIEKTAFKTKYGHFEFLVMPMGLRNAPATFQALMNSIFRDCIDDFVVVYLDDILIFSESREEHLNHLRIVLSRLRDHELYVGEKKFELMKTETEFLGLIVGRDGIKIGEERKRLIQEWPVPKTSLCCPVS